MSPSQGKRLQILAWHFFGLSLLTVTLATHFLQSIKEAHVSDPNPVTNLAAF